VSASAVPWHTARQLAHDAGERLPVERVRLDQAVGRVLAEDLRALIPVPHYASSAMDGWAVAGDGPWRLLPDDAVEAHDADGADGAQHAGGGAAGDGAERNGAARENANGERGAQTHRPDSGRHRLGRGLREGEAVRIVTGAVIPPGARGVLRSEHGVVSPDGSDGPGGASAVLAVSGDGVAGEPRAGLHVRPAGTEAVAGETVFGAGVVLTPPRVAVAAGCGHDEIAVVRRPRVTLVLTGGEVVEHGLPEAGTVRDSFGPTLPALLAGLGAEVVDRHRVGDHFAATLALFTAESVEAAAASDILVTTGGTGDSAADHVRPALRAAGATVLVDGIAVRPGAPALLARLPDGRFVIGLPGNPLAAMLALLTLAHPLVSAMQGRGMPALGRIRIAESLPPGKGPTALRSYRTVDGLAEPTAWHGAGMLRGLAEADGVLVVPRGGADAGAELEVLPLPW
jgi:molybdopterin molybdotransferase